MDTVHTTENMESSFCMGLTYVRTELGVWCWASNFLDPNLIPDIHTLSTTCVVFIILYYVFPISSATQDLKIIADLE